MMNADIFGRGKSMTIEHSIKLPFPLFTNKILVHSGIIVCILLCSIAKCKYAHILLQNIEKLQ